LALLHGIPLPRSGIYIFRELKNDHIGQNTEHRAQSTETKKLPNSFIWIGLYKCFERAGFEIVDRTSKN
jgi:hypothetical protein